MIGYKCLQHRQHVMLPNFSSDLYPSSIVGAARHVSNPNDNWVTGEAWEANFNCWKTRIRGWNDLIHQIHHLLRCFEWSCFVHSKGSRSCVFIVALGWGSSSFKKKQFDQCLRVIHFLHGRQRELIESHKSSVIINPSHGICYEKRAVPTVGV